MRMGPFGALYLGDATWVQLAREDRDAITEDGRAGINATVEAERIRIKRAEARAKARAAHMDAAHHLKLARAGKIPGVTMDGAKAKIAYAWQARAEARAI